MEKTRNKQIMTIALIMVAIVGLTVGFAAFTSQLSIKPGANVTPDSSDFVVRFSSSATGYKTGEVLPSDQSLGQSANISSSEPTTISNLIAEFSKPGDSVSYEFYARNDGKYDAYLNEVKIGNKSCVRPDGSDAQQSLIDAACSSISLSVDIDGYTFENSAVTNGWGSSKVDKNTAQTITITLTYASNGTYVDGPFSVRFEDIELIYSTVDNYTTGAKDLASLGLGNLWYDGGQGAVYVVDVSKLPDGMTIEDELFAFSSFDLYFEPITPKMTNQEFIDAYGSYLISVGNYFYESYPEATQFTINSGEVSHVWIYKTSGSNRIKVGQYYIELSVG